MLRSLPHGHVCAVLGSARKIGLDRMLAADRAPARMAALVLAMIVARVIDPASKLATARQLDTATATTSLGPLLDLDMVSEQDLYAALDWLLSQQSRIERRLAQRHLSQGTLVLYDVSSTYFEGRTCPLARRGYSRDGKRDKLQIVFGLLCASDGCPVAVEVFEGNTGDPEHAGRPGRQAQATFPPRPCCSGRRSWHDHRGTHRDTAATRRSRLDHRAACAVHQNAARSGCVPNFRCSMSATPPRSPRRSFPANVW